MLTLAPMRNGAPMLAVFTAFPDQDPRMLVMILLSGPVPAIVAFPLAAYCASRVGKAGVGEVAGVPHAGSEMKTATHGK